MGEKQKKAKNKINWGVMLSISLSVFLGGFFGFFIGFRVLDSFDGNIFEIAVMLILLYFSLIFQIIVHEGGHLLCGLFSGYEFISFRIGKLTLIKDNGGFKIKKHTIVGTGGQCLMMPTSENAENMPYILYNLGGVMANAIVALLCFAAYTWVPMPEILRMPVISCALIGLFIFVTNGIPMKIGGIANDGCNALSLGKDPVARRAFYLQLKVNGMQTKGVRIKDMPFEWFNLPDGADYDNPLICGIKIMEGSYYHDRHEFEKAKDCLLALLEKSKKLLPVYKNEIYCELLFYEIIGECRPAEIESYYTKDLQKYIKATSTYITRKRLMYAYALLVDRDTFKAEKALDEVYMVTKTSPVKAEVESELEIVEMLKALAI